jgi:TolB-like protein/DNA-binding winged helix-turn-helix (wHTH) protein/Flp pilus assembly protein TadD
MVANAPTDERLHHGPSRGRVVHSGSRVGPLIFYVALTVRFNSRLTHCFGAGVKSRPSPAGVLMASEPIRFKERISFGDDFELEVSARRLRRGTDVLKLEPIPLGILVLLLEHADELVTRDEIVAKVWGKGAFLDTDNSIRGAIRKIRQVLKDDPEHPQFIETVTGLGYRFIARLRLEEEETERGTKTPVNQDADHGSRGAVRARRWLVLGGVAVLALLTGTYITTRNRARHATGPKIESLAVLPLKNLSGDPTQEYLADGLTESVIGRLSMIRGLRVTSRTSVMPFKDTHMSAPEIAKKLHVDAIVEGSVIREGDRIRVHAQLIRGATDEHFWSETYDRDLSDALELESEVAQSIAQRVEVTVTGQERARLVSARPVLPEVYESYLKGRGQLAKGNSRADIAESITYFEEAIRKDTTFAPAYVGLAEAYDRLGLIFVGAPPDEVRPKVISAARKALELDQGLAQAHLLLADVYQKQWQWAEAEAEYRRALELNPNDAAAQAGFANWLLCQGRMEEALAWIQRARQHDPLAVSGVQTGWILFHARRYNEAIRELRGVLAVKPDDASALWFLGFALIGNGQSEEAIPVLEKVVSIMHNPGSIELLATANAHAGRRTEALRLISEMKRGRQTSYVPSGAFINPYLGLGDYDEAFAWFERAYQEKSNILQFLKVHPFFDPVRGDPRFADLLRRVGLD